MKLRIALLACVLVSALPAVTALEQALPSRIALSIAIAFIPYAFALKHANALASALVPRWVLACAALSSLPLLVAPPALSDDLYRYIWDGRVLLSGIDPYAFAPTARELSPLRDAHWPLINHPEIATIYPPIAQLLFAFTAWVSATPLAFKALAALLHLTCIVAVWKATGEDAPRATIAYGLNPLALEETAMNGHIDVAAGLFVLLAVYAVSKHFRGRALTFVSLATGIKLVGFLLVPAFMRERKSLALWAALCSMLVLAPQLGHAGDAQAGLTHYTRRWSGNALVHPALKSAVTSGLLFIADPYDRARGHVRLHSLEPLFAAVNGTALDPRLGIAKSSVQRAAPGDFEAAFLAGLIARVLCVATTFALALWMLRRGHAPLVIARATFLAALTCAPQVHPWYLLWLLPLEAALGSYAGIVWSASILVAYAPLDGWVTAHTWHESMFATVFEFAVVGLSLCAERCVTRRRRNHARLPPVSDHSQRA